MNIDDEKYMKMALEEAKEAFSCGEVPVGAVVVKEGLVIGKGHNNRENENRISGHAEILAIEAAEKKLGSWDLSGCTLYVSLEPCLMCSGAILQSRIKRVVFGALDEKMGAVISNLHVFDQKIGNNIPPLVTSRVLKNESAALLKSFFAKQRG